MSYPTVVTHSKRYPATSIMADPYSCDNTGVVDVYDGITQLKADQANVGTMLVPAGTYLVDTNLTIPVGMDLRLYAGASFSISTGVVLTIASPTGINYKTGRIISGNGTVSFVDGSIVRTSWFGGIVNLLNYLEGTPDINVIFDMDETIANTLEIPSNIRVSSPYGITVTIADLVTLTIAGPVDLGNPLTFAYVGSGNVIYSNTGALTYLYVYPQMWNAVGNGTTDDTTAMQSCFDSGYDLNVPVYLPPGTYLCQPLTYGENAVGAESDCAPEIYGAGSASIIKAKAGSTGVFFSATNIKNKILRDFVIDANDVAGITYVIDTDWYTTGDLYNVYRNIQIKNWAGVAWTAVGNTNCIWDHISIIDPKDSTNQKAFNISGLIVQLSNFACEGYIDFSGTSLYLDGVACYGVDANTTSLVLSGCFVSSNSATAACINADTGSIVVTGGLLSTVAGRNHIKGTYDSGGTFTGVTFDGAAGEDIFEGSVAASAGYPLFTFYACNVTANATLNDEAGYILREHFTNQDGTFVSSAMITSQSFVTAGNHVYTPTPGYKWALVISHGGGGEGDSVGAGGGGGGTCIEIFDIENDLGATENLTVGAGGTGGAGDGGATSFGTVAYHTASGGAHGTAAAGGAGGAASGGLYNYPGQAGYDDTAADYPGYGGASYGLYGGKRSAGAGNTYGGGGAVGGNDGAVGCVIIWELMAELRYIAELIALAGDAFGYHFTNYQSP